jgi:hypothetical protein
VRRRWRELHRYHHYLRCLRFDCAGHFGRRRWKRSVPVRHDRTGLRTGSLAGETGRRSESGDGPVTFEYCDYIFEPGNAPGVTVAVADLGSNGVSFFDQFRQSKAAAEWFQEVPGSATGRSMVRAT